VQLKASIKGVETHGPGVTSESVRWSVSDELSTLAVVDCEPGLPREDLNQSKLSRRTEAIGSDQAIRSRSFGPCPRPVCG
jgi:hypothetical protein